MLSKTSTNTNTIGYSRPTQTSSDASLSPTATRQSTSCPQTKVATPSQLHHSTLVFSQSEKSENTFSIITSPNSVTSLAVKETAMPTEVDHTRAEMFSHPASEYAFVFTLIQACAYVTARIACKMACN